MNRNRGVAFALATAMVSGVSVFANGIAVRHFDDATVYTTAKNLVAGAVLAGVLTGVLVAPSRVDVGSVVRRQWPALALVAFVGGAVPFVLFFEGLARATSTNAGFIHKTLVVWVAIGATLVLRERVTAVHVGAIGLLVAGHVVLTGGLGAATVGAAEVLVLAATLLWAVEVLLVKRLLADVPAQLAATVRMVGGSALLLVWLAVTGRLDELAALGGRQWLWVLLTGATLAAYVGCWYVALSLAPAVDVTALLVLGAVITGLLDTGFRDAPLTTDSYGYVLLAAGALAVAGRATARQPVLERAGA